jgi:conflict system STAND superfamily ATPase
LYDRFEDVYVPPIEYEEIEKNLKDHRCVFIIGTPEYGKTFTAIKLLWEYYKDGHITQYIDEGSEKASDIINKLGNLDKSLENNIIYLEDPVGKTKYKLNKEFEESIGTIMSGLGRINAFLIVTMREKIYNDFDPIGKKRIEEHVNKLNVGKRSYDYEKRKEMLLRWVSPIECKWVKIEELKNDVLEYIKNEIKLPTPLNIKDFASETADIITRDILEKKLDEISQRTPERFARDIEEMKERGEICRILFLCFLLVSL